MILTGDHTDTKDVTVVMLGVSRILNILQLIGIGISVTVINDFI